MATTPPGITPQELPKLIAAAVEKALTAHPVTQQELANFGKVPIRCGIFPVDPVIRAAETPSDASIIIPQRPLPFGFILREFEQLLEPARVEPMVGTEKEQ